MQVGLLQMCWLFCLILKCNFIQFSQPCVDSVYWKTVFLSFILLSIFSILFHNTLVYFACVVALDISKYIRVIHYFLLPGETNNKKNNNNKKKKNKRRIITIKIRRRGGMVVTAVASQQGAPGSNPGPSCVEFVCSPCLNGVAPHSPKTCMQNHFFHIAHLKNNSGWA